MRNLDLLITAIAPMIWGTSYFVTTEYLPHDYPLTLAMLRALPVGLLLLVFVRHLPTGAWWLKAILLGGLNFSIFWWMLFEAAYRLPGGVAATVGAIQPLIVIFLASRLLGSAIRPLSVIAGVGGLCGVGLLILSPEAQFDTLGLAAGAVGALSMALGTVLSRKWKPPVSLITFTSWQLVAGGLLLVPAAFIFEPPLPPLSTENYLGLGYLGLIGAGMTYILWFRGIAKLDPASVSALGFLSPVTAVVVGWLLLEQSLSLVECLAVVLVLASVWLSQFAAARPFSFYKALSLFKL